VIASKLFHPSYKSSKFLALPKTKSYLFKRNSRQADVLLLIFMVKILSTSFQKHSIKCFNKLNN